MKRDEKIINKKKKKKKKKQKKKKKKKKKRRSCTMQNVKLPGPRTSSSARNPDFI
jgi:hypothetical protein